MRVRATVLSLVLLGLSPLAHDTDAAEQRFVLGARAPGSFRSWTVKSEGLPDLTLSQTHIPLVGYFALSPNADVVVSAQYGSAEADADGVGSASLDGGGDIKVQGFLRTWENRAQFQLGMNLPTGKTGLTPEELAVAQAISSTLLQFRMKQYGQGFDLSAGAALAFPVARGTALGVGAGFVARGEYELLAGAPDYDPAGEFALSFGLERESEGHSRKSVLSLDATLRFYGSDQVSGQTVFEEGTQFELQAGGTMIGEGLNGSAVLRTVFKGDNTSFSQVGQIVEGIKSASGTDVLLLAHGDTPLSPRFRLGGQLEWHWFGGSDSSGEEGNTFGLGPTGGYGFGQGWWGRMAAVFLTGSMEDHRDLSGFFLEFSLSWQGIS